MKLDVKLAEYMDKEGYSFILDGASTLLRYDNEEEQRKCGDVRISFKGQEYNVEEKAHSGLSDDCLLELIQAIEGERETRKTWGWWFDLHECHYLLNGYFRDGGDEPVRLVLLKWKQLREHVFWKMREEGRKYRTAWSLQGYGITLCMFVPYADIPDSIKRVKDIS